MKNSNFVITVSYGNYMTGVGGTDKVILSQQKICNDNGINVIHLFSYDRYARKQLWSVLINGCEAGVYSSGRLKSFINKLYKNKNRLCGIIIHHLKDVSVSLLDELMDYCNVPVIFYLHDYYTICPFSGLILKDGSFCGNGFPSYDKCCVCSYYDDSVSIADNIICFFEKYSKRITFISPSDCARNVWLKDYPQYTENTKVIYHQQLIGSNTENNEYIGNCDPLRIAFVGYQMPIKGWIEFKAAVNEAMNRGLNEEFYQFGWGNDKIDSITQVNIDFKENISSMIDALRDRKIHVAVLWSKWPETYSYTYYESMAANCFVITNSNSGNISVQVSDRKNGCISESLTDIICNESKLRDSVNSFRVSQHNSPDFLKENEDFIKLLNSSEWFPHKNIFVFDRSTIISFSNCIKKFLKFRK